MVSVAESTSFTWRLSVKTAPEKPRFIIVRFQTDNDDNQTKNRSIFNHENLKDAHVMLNTDRYPSVDYNLSFSNQKCSRVHLFAVKLFGMDELITQSNITPSDYKTTYFSYSMSASRKKNSNLPLLIFK